MDPGGASSLPNTKYERFALSIVARTNNDGNVMNFLKKEEWTYCSQKSFDSAPVRNRAKASHTNVVVSMRIAKRDLRIEKV